MDGQKLNKGNMTYIIVDKKAKMYYITQDMENAKSMSKACGVNTISLNKEPPQEFIDLIHESKKAQKNIYITATNNDPIGERIREQLNKCFREEGVLSMDCHMLRTDRTVKDFKEYWLKHYGDTAFKD